MTIIRKMINPPLIFTSTTAQMNAHVLDPLRGVGERVRSLNVAHVRAGGADWLERTCDCGAGKWLVLGVLLTYGTNM